MDDLVILVGTVVFFGFCLGLIHFFASLAGGES